MIKSDNAKVGEETTREICSTFSRLENKEQAWEDLLALTKDPDSFVRWSAADALGSVVQYLPDKEQAWEDLLVLTKDPDSNVRWSGAEALDAAVQYLPDKEHVWKDLLALTKDKDSYVRWRAADALGSAFQYLPDKEQASKDLLALTKNQDIFVRIGAVGALGSVFQYLPDKEQASKDLLALTKDQDSGLQGGAAVALGFAFQYLPDKEQASKDLLALTKDQDSDVRRRAAEALGFAFQYLPDKEQAWEDLLALTKGEESDVRVSANHSLGKISVYRATTAEDEDLLQKELDNAIGFFEKSATSARESKWINPAEFCLPFYRAYYSVIFTPEEAGEDIKENLDEAKHAVSGSESREKLLEAVENLSNALNEAQNLRDLDDIKADLNAYRRYCDRACEILDTTEKTAPGATKLIRRGLPEIDKRIQGMLAEIREKAEAVCRQSLNTPFEDFGTEINQISQDLLKVRNPITLEKQINIMLTALSPICDKISEIDSEACRYYQMAQQEQYLEDKIPLINMILSKIPTHLGIGEKLDEIQILLEPKRKKELVFSLGGNFYGSGGQLVYTIPLDEIHYSGLEEDIEEIKDKNKFSNFPVKLTGKIKDYLIRNKKYDLLDRLI